MPPQVFSSLMGQCYADMDATRGYFSTCTCNTSTHRLINTLRPRQNGRHFADDIFKCIFLNENAWILIKISLKFVPKGSINNIPALVQIMAWRRPGDKPLFEPMLVRIPTHICVTRPQWVNTTENLHPYKNLPIHQNPSVIYLTHWPPGDLNFILDK